jgi:Raf kinase inhibitor-like YbhB/YbcL family protein
MRPVPEEWFDLAWHDVAMTVRVRVRVRGAALVACLFLAACQAPAAGTAHPTPAPPGPIGTGAAATIAPRPSEVPMQTSEPATAGPFTLTSAAFADGGSIPRTYACDGQDSSPPLAWTGAPAATSTLALVMTDPDAGGFVHWVVFNVDASVSGGFPAGFAASPDGPAQGRNSFGRVGYGGPCPPSGTHHYVFRLLALDAELPLTGTPTAKAVLEAAAGHILAEATLTGTYRKGG